MQEKKVVIATHVYATGPAQDLKDYLVGQKCNKLLFIGHPLLYNANLNGSGFEFFKEGRKVEEHYSQLKDNFGLLRYFRDFWNNICFTIKNGRSWDLYVGSDNLNALSGILLRRLGIVSRCVYYVIDYNPKRFKNRMMNWAYHKIDRFCVRHADETWNLSPRMSEARKKYFNFFDNKQRVVPIGVWYSRFKCLEFSQIDQNSLVYMGHVVKKQGIQYVLEAIPEIVKKIPNFKFLVVGGGDYLAMLKKQSEGLGISKYVTYSGFVENHRDVEKLLSKSALSIAMYDKYDEDGNLSFTYFSDPGKIKSYLASGLPILLTEVPHNAREIQQSQCGRIIEQNKESIAKAVIEMLSNKTKLEGMRKKACMYAERFDWDNIFEDNLKRILEKNH